MPLSSVQGGTLEPGVISHMSIGVQIVAFLAGAVGFIAGIWLLGLAFRESTVWGLAVLFIPFAGLVFIIRHWEDAKGPFFLQMGNGIIACAIVAAIVWTDASAKRDAGPQFPSQKEIMEKIAEDNRASQARMQAERDRAMQQNRPYLPTNILPTPRPAANPVPTPVATPTPAARTQPNRVPTPTPPPGPKVEWNLAGWDSPAKRQGDDPMTKVCVLVKARRFGRADGWVGVAVGPPAKDANDPANKEHLAQVRGQFNEGLAKLRIIPGKQELTQNIEGIDYDRIVVSADKAMATVLTTIQDGRCMDYWYDGPMAGWETLKLVVGRAKVIEP
jgi:hypothetical protein